MSLMKCYNLTSGENRFLENFKIRNSNSEKVNDIYETYSFTLHHNKYQWGKTIDVFSICKLVTQCWFIEGFLNNKVKHSNLIDAFNQANTQIGHAFKFVGQPMVFNVIWISCVWERKKIQTVNQVQK